MVTETLTPALPHFLVVAGSYRQEAFKKAQNVRTIGGNCRCSFA
jgi:hypothetical protein